jgi:uncharacterized membrane protein
LKNEEVKQVVSQVIQEIQFSGPIPPPNIISGYEKILPGAADRILAMAEKQSEHRQEMEKKMVEAESRDGLLGIICGFTLGVGCIAAAIIRKCRCYIRRSTGRYWRGVNCGNSYKKYEEQQKR